MSSLASLAKASFAQWNAFLLDCWEDLSVNYVKLLRNDMHKWGIKNEKNQMRNKKKGKRTKKVVMRKRRNCS